MRKFLPFLFAAALASSCIDNAYDLSNVNTDDVTIGDEDSEYRLPLATVYVSMSELNEGGADIKTLFDEADIWLPSPLPGNAAYVDLRELQNTPETITPLLDALIDQMMDDDAKITAVADLLALAGGFCFALTNVTLRRLHAVPGEARMLAMFGGGALMATASACAGLLAGFVTPVPALAMGWVVVALLLATAFLLSNYALQYGATRLAAGTTALIMLSEVVFASVSSVLLTDTALDARTVLGGSLIVSAALLATLRWPRKA